LVAPGIWKLLHLFFAFSFVGALVVADWNGRAARATSDWGQRALLFDIIRIASGVAGLGSLIALGVFGNVLAPLAGWQFRHNAWMHVVNGVWLVMVAIMAFVTRPAIGRLAAISRAATTGGTGEGYEAALKRWRIGNVALSLLYLAMLVLMVFRWHS
jgi:hypothetical protein